MTESDSEKLQKLRTPSNKKNKDKKKLLFAPVNEFLPNMGSNRKSPKIENFSKLVFDLPNK